MKFKISKDLNECKRLWNTFSPKKLIWGIWDVVVCFYDPNLNEPYFIISIEEGKETGVLPLWFEKESGEYHFFGGEFPENRIFWFDVKYFNDFMKQIPGPVKLFYINATEFDKITKLNDPELTSKFEIGDKRYFINLEKLNYNLDEYLNTFNKKHKKNLKYDIKQLEKLNYKVISESTEHFDTFVELSIKRFGKESDLSDNDFVKQMRNFLEYFKSEKMIHTISIEIDNKIEAVEFAAFYNGVYYVLNGASNKEIKNLGKLLIMNHIKNAISLKAKEVDFLAGNSGWKELWNCEEENNYDYRTSML